MSDQQTSTTENPCELTADELAKIEERYNRVADDPEWFDDWLTWEDVPALLAAHSTLRADLARARAVVEAAQRLRQASWPERQEPRLWRELDVVLDAHQQEPGAGQA